MENVILVVHLLLALSLIGVVLLQRSEGGGLGIGGGGGGGGGAMSSRSAATALGKITWILAAAFICTSIALTILSAQQASDASVVGGDSLLPPTSSSETPSDGTNLLPPVATTPSSDALLPDAN